MYIFSKVLLPSVAFSATKAFALECTAHCANLNTSYSCSKGCKHIPFPLYDV